MRFEITMIGKLKGKIVEIYGNEAYLETQGGVFYKVFITPEIVQQYPLNTEIELYTYLNVREDELTLFAFNTVESYRIFMMLINVDGVGPKMAYSIIASHLPNAIRQAVLASDVEFFQQVKGVGKKTAQRILVDLTDKFGEEFDIATIQESPEDIDVIDALVALGFKRSDARKTLQKLDKTARIEDKIKQALQILSEK